VRTVILSAVALIGLAAVAVGVLINSLNPPGDSGSPPEGTPGSFGTASSSGSSGPEGPGIRGEISIAANLLGRVSASDTLFIIARKGPGPPFAVKRIREPRFPLSYRLGPEDVMTAGTPFQGEVEVSARLSKTGAAGPAQPGDLGGEHPGRVPLDAGGVDIVIARIH
jgi:cytochrome c-type biogenesis protein CcmH